MPKKLVSRCIFCRNLPLTSEHVIANWMRQIIPRKSSDGRRFTHSTDLPSSIGHINRRTSSYIQRGHPGSKKVRCVCARCNNGWMAGLEGELKPTLKKVISGKDFVITEWEQRRLSTWAAKTSMTAEFIDPKSVAILFAEREYLRLHNEPPKHFDIWVGCYDGPRPTTALHHHSNHISLPEALPKEPRNPNTQATVIRLGRLFVQVFSSNVPELRAKLGDERRSKLRRIWPPVGNEFNWQSIRKLYDKDIEIILMGLDRAFASSG